VRTPAVLGVLVATLALLPLDAGADAAQEDDCACSRTPDRTSRSRGYPWRGRLDHGVRLHESHALRFMNVDRPRGNFWGTEELVSLLQRVARRVDAVAPGARLNLGELSKQRGGNIVGHRSHENGRDVDIGFYMLSEAGLPVETRRFENVGRSGTARVGEDTLHFDDARNWLLIRALVTDPDVTVQHAFVHPRIRERILREGARQGASQQLLARVERVVMSPHTRHPHRNHFHVRIYCPAGDVPGCHDRGPYWPWIAEREAAHPFLERVMPNTVRAVTRDGAWSATDTDDAAGAS